MVADAITLAEQDLTMDDRTRQTLDHSQTIDITTTGRRTGQARRIEIVSHNFGGRIFISGMPRRRSRAWLLNLRRDPRLTMHLKGALTADLPATARVIDDEAEHHRILMAPWPVRGAATDIEEMVAWSPLIEVAIPGYGVDVAA